MSQYDTLTIELASSWPPDAVSLWADEHADAVDRREQYGQSLVYLIDLSTLRDDGQSGSAAVRQAAKGLFLGSHGTERLCHFQTNDTSETGWARLYARVDGSIQAVDEVEGERGACGVDVRETLQRDHDFVAYSANELFMGPDWAEVE